MPVVRAQEIQVTDEDVSSTGSSSNQPVPVSSPTPRPIILERVAKFISTASADELLYLRRVLKSRELALGLVQPQQKAGIIDQALLYVYLNVTPFIIALLLVIPLVFWLGRIYLRQVRPLLNPGRLLESCPPNCLWPDLFFWAALGGIALLITLVFSYLLRDRLLKARNRG